jgi:hypothetical protein
LAHAFSKCEFSFNRKGLSWGAEFQLAVRWQPVYNPAPLPLPDKATPGLVRRSFSEGD